MRVLFFASALATSPATLAQPDSTSRDKHPLCAIFLLKPYRETVALNFNFIYLYFRLYICEISKILHYHTSVRPKRLLKALN